MVKIATGYHMNSHKPSDSYLIPTTLTPQLPDGFTLVASLPIRPAETKNFRSRRISR